MDRPLADVFTSYRLGPVTLKNRMVMAPLTRSRAVAGNVPSPLAAEYYAQRAGAGLIVTEATQVSPGAQGYISTPGVHEAAQVERWALIAEAVHERGGRIYMQLWHVGRISHPDFRGGELPVAPSAIAPRGVQTYTPGGLKAVPVPRALTLDEIPEIVHSFRTAAYNARAAGFDGVEVHGANGYLLDQFLEDCTNQRDDDYGGSIENRARLLLECVDAVSDAIGRERVGVRLSPGGTFNDMCDSDPQATWGHAVREIANREIAYLHLNETQAPQGEHPTPDLSARYFRPMYPGTLIVAGGYTLERANAVIQEGLADLVAFGQLFLANPDLPTRFEARAPLNKPDPSTYYGGGAKGYVDYPTLA